MLSAPQNLRSVMTSRKANWNAIAATLWSFTLCFNTMSWFSGRGSIYLLLVALNALAVAIYTMQAIRDHRHRKAQKNILKDSSQPKL